MSEERREARCKRAGRYVGARTRFVEYLSRPASRILQKTLISFVQAEVAKWRKEQRSNGPQAASRNRPANNEKKNSPIDLPKHHHKINILLLGKLSSQQLHSPARTLHELVRAQRARPQQYSDRLRVVDRADDIVRLKRGRGGRSRRYRDSLHRSQNRVWLEGIGVGAKGGRLRG